MDIETLVSKGANISISITLPDLKEYSLSLIRQGIEIGMEQYAEKQYLTQKEAAEKLNVSENTLWRWKKSGYLVPVKVGNGVYYRLSDIQNLYNSKD